MIVSGPAEVSVQKILKKTLPWSPSESVQDVTCCFERNMWFLFSLHLLKQNPVVLRDSHRAAADVVRWVEKNR